MLVRPRAGLKRDWLIAYLFLLPSFLSVVVFLLFPLGMGVFVSFTEWSTLQAPKFIGLANYARLLQDDRVRITLLNTAYYAALLVPLDLVLPLLLALAMNQKIRGIVAFRTFFFMPVVTSMVAVALIWRWLYNSEFGLLNTLLYSVGIPAVGWLTDPAWAMPSIVLMTSWKGAGYNMILYLAGLQGIPEQYYEAAKIDGANGYQQFRYITVPLLTPTMFFILIMTLIGAFQVFDSVYMMTGGGPGTATLTVVYHIYSNAFQTFAMGYAAAIAWLLFAIIFAITFIQFRVGRAWVRY